MKYRLITAVTLALVVGLAGPAMAKEQGGPGQAEISGDGLSAPIRIRWGAGCRENDFCTTLTHDSGMYIFDRSGNLIPTPPPASELGPQFRIAYTFSYVIQGDLHTERAVQYVYPFARGGRVVFMTPAGQGINGFISDLWWAAPAGSGVLGILTRHGLPSNPVGPTIRELPSLTVQPWVVFGLVAMLGSLLFVAGARARRTARVTMTRV
jgi:hypothetical protein